jgi:hypothetical protein
MDGKRNQFASSGTLPVEPHDLHRLMEEVLALRENVMSLEQNRKETSTRAISDDGPVSTGAN